MDNLSPEAEASVPEGATFQPDPGIIRWRMFFRAPPTAVYRAVATSEGRARFWAESAVEREGVIRFVVPGGHESEGRIVERIPDHRFVTEYFGWTVEFSLQPASGGTDLTMTCSGVSEESKNEVVAGWVSVLMAMKAAIDHGVDLRNHDPARTWWQGYADN